jgi:RNA polymerase sigma-70 factor (ECF subfamily)
MTPSSERPTREERFESLFQNNRSGILAYFLRRVGLNSDAADLLADTFLVAWRRLDEIPGDDAGRMWLFGVARRVLANYHRHELAEHALAGKLRQQIALETAQRVNPDSGPFDDVIATSLEVLSKDDREIIELSAWERLTPTEIASVLEMKPGTVRTRLHRIRRILAPRLISAGYPATVGAECTT